MIVVLDANIALALLIPLPYTAAAHEAVEKASRVLAPDLIVHEFTNGLWRMVRAGHATPDQSDEALARLPAVIDTIESSHELAKPALHDAVRVDHAVYDLFYVALARKRNATLITADRKLARHARTLGVPVTEVGETGSL